LADTGFSFARVEESVSISSGTVEIGFAAHYPGDIGIENEHSLIRSTSRCRPLASGRRRSPDTPRGAGPKANRAPIRKL
jgi:hypothetical protein